MYVAWVSDEISLGSQPAVDADRICSAKGCRSLATTDLRWRNPRIHDAARVKHWLACDAHADQLADFLARRGFLLERVTLRSAADG